MLAARAVGVVHVLVGSDANEADVIRRVASMVESKFGIFDVDVQVTRERDHGNTTTDSRTMVMLSELCADCQA